MVGVDRVVGFTPRYAYASGLVKALSRSLLPTSLLLKLADAPDYASAVEGLRDTEYGPLLGEGKNVEEVLKLKQGELWELADGLLGEHPDWRTVKYFYDFQNLKSAMVGDEPESLFGNLTPSEVSLLAEEGVGDSWLVRAVKRALEAEKRWGRFGLLTEIDRAYYEGAVRAKSKFMREFQRTFVDLLNLKTFFRHKALGRRVHEMEYSLVKGGKLPLSLFSDHYEAPPRKFLVKVDAISDYGAVVEEGITALDKKLSFARTEKAADDVLSERIRTTKYGSCSVDVVLGYVFAKLWELKGIRILLVGKRNSIPPDEIKDRLPKLMV